MLEPRDDRVARRNVDRAAQSSWYDNATGGQGLAELGELVREPRDRFGRMSKHRGADAFFDRDYRFSPASYQLLARS